MINETIDLSVYLNSLEMLDAARKKCGCAPCDKCDRAAEAQVGLLKMMMRSSRPVLTAITKAADELATVIPVAAAPAQVAVMPDAPQITQDDGSLVVTATIPKVGVERFLEVQKNSGLSNDKVLVTAILMLLKLVEIIENGHFVFSRMKDGSEDPFSPPLDFKIVKKTFVPRVVQ